MGQPVNPRIDEYKQRLVEGVRLVRTGEHPAALGEFEAAHALAVELGDRELQMEARANVAMVQLQLGEDRRAEAGLREILLGSRDHRILFGAAYNLAVSQRKQGRHERARFYAAKAMHSAARLKDPGSRAGCHNLMGNILMNESRLDEALVEYRKALRIRKRQKTDVRFSTAILLENIGYTYLLKRQFRRGTRLVAQALGLATEVGAKRCMAESYQDLCYAALRIGAYDEANEHGEKALALSREHGYKDVEKNCYYLLGEAAHLDGRPVDRDRHFESLQRLHPELPFLTEFLCAFDLSDVLTLKR